MGEKTIIYEVSIIYLFLSFLSFLSFFSSHLTYYHDSDISRTFDNPKNEPANNALIKISPLIL